MNRVIRALCVILMIVCSEAFAQNVGTGLYAFGSFDSRGFDSLNLGNLNIHFAIPVISKQGRGLSFNYALVYEGLVWSPVTSAGSTTWVADQDYGFRGQLDGTITGYITYVSVLTGCGRGTGTLRENYVYHDPFGKNHYIPYFPGFCGAQPAAGTATDGSGYSISSAGVLSRFGQIINAPQNPPPASINNGSMTDRNGNMITNNGNGTFTDTLGVTALTIGGSQTPSSPLTLTYPVTAQANGTTSATATISYKAYIVQTNFQCSGIIEAGAKSTNLVDHLSLADGSTYSFTYENTPSVSGAVTGRLASVTLPSGGVVSFAYSGGCNGSSGINADGTTSGLTRTTTDGARTYTRTSNSSISTSTTLQDEKGNQSLFTFTLASGLFYETHRKLYQGTTSSGSLLMERFTCYNGSTASCDGVAITLPLTEADKIESYNGGSQAIVKNSYTAGGALLTNSAQYSGSTILEQTGYNYNSLGEPLSSTTTDGSGNTLSASTYGYDETTPTATSGLPQHVAVSGTRGNQTSAHRTYAGTSTLTATTAYYDTGMPVSTTTPNGKTSYTYDSSQTFATQTTLPTPPSGVSLNISATYDASSGAMLTSTGMNTGQTKTVNYYDSLLRPKTITLSNGGEASFSYSPTQTSMTQNLNLSTGQNAEEAVLYDAYGRTVRHATFNGQSTNAYYQTDTCYDATGLTRFVSLQYQSTGTGSEECSGTGKSYIYDALGRPTSIVTPDGTVTIQYFNRAVETTDVNGVQKIRQYDSLGRVTGVCEITSTALNGLNPTACGMDISGTGFVTSYAYTLATHTTSITQGVQTRTFVTDDLGRTTSVTEPERGTTTYAYAYNGTGLSVVRTRPRANQSSATTVTQTTTQYDSLGRVASISYSDSTGVSKNYFYDVLPSGQGWTQTPNNTKGMLTATSSGVAGSTLAQTEYSYDLMGNVLATWECGPSICGTSSQSSRELQFAYDLGNHLVTEADAASGAIAYTVSPAGEVTSITNNTYQGTGNPAHLVSAVTNGPSGPTVYTLGNGLNTVQSYDSLGRNNGGWVCLGSAATGCTGGTQLYGNTSNFSGNRMTGGCDTVINQCESDTYDAMNRLTAVSGGSNSFTYTYDRWGNRLSQTATLGSGSSPNGAVNPATNQLSAIAYDAAGNQEADGISHTFTYDAEGNLTAVDNGSTAVYVYDALNRRVRVVTTNGSYEYLFDVKGRRISTWQVSNNFGVEGRIYWGKKQLAFRAQNGNTFFEHQSYLGTERLRTSYQGSVAATEFSLAFGDDFNQTVSLAYSNQDNGQYAGLEHDSESGSEHAQFRQYSSIQGRWMSPDPYDGSYRFTNPQSFNRYSYVRNNPLVGLDSSGQDDTNTLAPADDVCEDVVCFVDDSGDPSPDYGGGGGEPSTGDQTTTSSSPSSSDPSLPAPPLPVSVIQGGPVPWTGPTPNAGDASGTTFQGNLFFYTAVDANGEVASGFSSISENISDVEGNLGVDPGTVLISNSPYFTDYVGVYSQPNGSFGTNSFSNQQTQTFTVNVPNAPSYSLSTVIQQSVAGQNGIVTSATATIIVP